MKKHVNTSEASRVWFFQVKSETDLFRFFFTQWKLFLNHWLRKMMNTCGINNILMIDTVKIQIFKKRKE